MGKLRDICDRVLREMRTYQFVLRDPRTPWLPKIILGLAVAYALSPIDIIPDCVPVVGYLDDLLIVPGLVWLACRMIPAEIIEDCRARS